MKKFLISWFKNALGLLGLFDIYIILAFLTEHFPILGAIVAAVAMIPALTVLTND